MIRIILKNLILQSRQYQVIILNKINPQHSGPSFFLDWLKSALAIIEKKSFMKDKKLKTPECFYHIFRL